MSITIHHGPNGSYKTAGVVNDYFIPAAREGRVVVTNIKGMTRERTLTEMPEIPDSFDVIYLDQDTNEGRWQIATWFHWVPFGALLLFDEAGVMFPKQWRDKELSRLDYPSLSLEYCDLATRQVRKITYDSIDSAALEGRPANWLEAWQKHRHWNWDIILTVPNIKSVRDDIRETTEGAYKHKNRAVLGPMFKGYNEGYHDATKNGVSQSDFDTIRSKRVAGLAFRLYDSTRTGVFKGTLNGFNLFLTPRVLILLVVAVGAFSYSFIQSAQGILTGVSLDDLADQSTGAAASESVASAAVPAVSVARPAAAAVPPAAVVSPSLADVKSLAAAFDHAGRYVDSGTAGEMGTIKGGPLDGIRATLTGVIKKGDQSLYLVELSQDDERQVIFSYELNNLGYSLHPRGDCAVQIRFRRQSAVLSCFQVAAR